MCGRLALLLVCVAYASALTYDDEKNLLANLFGNYSPLFPPHDPSDDHAHVHFEMKVTRVNDFDPVHQEVNFDALFVVEYHEPHFEWNPSDYGDLHHVVVPLKMVWNPDLLAYDSAGHFHFLSDPDEAVRVDSNGNVWHSHLQECHMYCHTPTEHVPQGENVTCDLEFAMSYYGKDEVELGFFKDENNLPLPELDPSHVHPDFSHDWHSLGLSHTSHVYTAPDQVDYDVLEYHLVLHRVVQCNH